jgi:hypothetical protein
VPSDAQLSPDGKWLAYTGQTPTGPTLKTEAVFVEPFPPTGAKYQISTDSEDGHHAVWTSNGTELLYTPGPGPRLSVVTMRASPAPSFSQPKPLARLFTNGPPSSPRPYDAARDGHSIVALADPSDPASGGAMPLQIDVVLNWLDRRRR